MMRREMMTDSHTIQIHLLLFAAHRGMVGSGKLVLDVPEGSTVEDVYLLLESSQPLLASLRPCTSFAVNREIVSGSTRLEPGDELAFLQPVSGGLS